MILFALHPVYKHNPIHHQPQSTLKGSPMNSYPAGFADVTNEFLDKIEGFIQQPNYNAYAPLLPFWLNITEDIANELPFVLASRSVSLIAKEELNLHMRSYWSGVFVDAYYLTNEVDKIILLKIGFQLCCKRFLARKRLAELKHIKRQRELALAMAHHTRLGERSILATLTRDLLLACLV